MKAQTESLLSRFKALADPVRTRIVALCLVAECSVSELTAITGQSQPRVSQHLKQLCAADLLERFKDGHFVFYRVRHDGADAADRRRLLAILPTDEPQFVKDIGKLRAMRADDTQLVAISDADRSLHRALLELTVARPLGDLLDIGCGQGRILKLLASRAHRSVGVDIDSDARRHARAKLLLAGSSNTSLRQGDMVSLPFDDAEFDTVILDDVLTNAKDADAALTEAKRLLRPNGQLLLLVAVNATNIEHARKLLIGLAAQAELRLALPRSVPTKNPNWLLAVATVVDRSSAAA